jgi:hypothetical protein
MKHRLSQLAIAALLSPALAGAAISAESSDSQIEISGTVGRVCVLPTPIQTAGSNARFNNGQLVIDELIDENTATVRASSVQITFPKAMCNYNASITIGSQNVGLTLQAEQQALSDNFIRKVPYKLNGKWGSVDIPVLDTASEGMVSRTAGGANLGDLTITVTTENGTQPALHGEYRDIIVLKLGSAM